MKRIILLNEIVGKFVEFHDTNQLVLSFAFGGKDKYKVVHAKEK